MSVCPLLQIIFEEQALGSPLTDDGYLKGFPIQVDLNIKNHKEAKSWALALLIKLAIPEKQTQQEHRPQGHNFPHSCELYCNSV